MSSPLLLGYNLSRVVLFVGLLVLFFLHAPDLMSPRFRPVFLPRLGMMLTMGFMALTLLVAPARNQPLKGPLGFLFGLGHVLLIVLGLFVFTGIVEPLMQSLEGELRLMGIEKEAGQELSQEEGQRVLAKLTEDERIQRALFSCMLGPMFLLFANFLVRRFFP